jgi:methylglutaconyl-CoA hydratase
MISELTDCFSSVKKKKEARAVVITGAGKSFCAGADLNWMKRMSALSREENVNDAKKLSSMFEKLASVEVPVIARVNGAAFGGGAGLVCACDFAIASDNAKIGFSEVKLGLLPGVISPYVIERIGVKRAVQLFTTGERLDAQKAKTYELVDQVVPTAELDIAVSQLVNQILTGGPLAVENCKKLALTYNVMSAASFKRYCIDAIATARASEEGKEGMQAFLEKKEPSWRKIP